MSAPTPEEREAARQRGEAIGKAVIGGLLGNAPPKPPKPKLTSEEAAQAKYEKALAAYELKQKRLAEGAQWAKEHPVQQLVIIIVVLAVVAMLVLGFFHWISQPSKPLPPEPFYGTKALVKQYLNDPDSAQFSNTFHIKKANGDEILCGSVNAKNGFGGYAGYQPFVALSDYEVIIGDPYKYQTECTR